jgi:DNA-binding PadR family transcriptional regulator
VRGVLRFDCPSEARLAQLVGVEGAAFAAGPPAASAGQVRRASLTLGLDARSALAYFVSTVPPAPTALGEFETLLILAILHLTEQKKDAYGSAIREEIETRTRRAVPRGSIYVTLDRLEEKGLLASREGGASAARGNRPKRIFRATPSGTRAVKVAVLTLTRMQRGLEGVLGRA